MPVVSVRIPQLGEGLQEALLVEFLKKPGDPIRRDEPIYVMETDKATTDVESPFAGVLVEWTVQAGTVLSIGSEVARMEVAEGVKEMPSGHAPVSVAGPETGPGRGLNQPAVDLSSTSQLQESHELSVELASGRSDVFIPPKTRKYLKEVGLLNQADQIPVRGSKMMPEDVDAYLAARGTQTSAENDRKLPAGVGVLSALAALEPHSLVPLPKSQITLNYRMMRGAGVCIPVTLFAELDWTALQNVRSALISKGGPHRGDDSSDSSNGTGDQSVGETKAPTGFALACWGVVQAMKQHAKFRSVLTSDGTSLRVFSHVNLGVAVALPGDEMVTAVIRHADQMSALEFFRIYEANVQAARQGQDQADETTTLTVSNIGKVGMRMGIPAVVAPAVATLALGEVFPLPVPDGSSFKFRPTVTATLSFDHRIVNGVGAANFLNELCRYIEALSSEIID